MKTIEQKQRRIAAIRKRHADFIANAPADIAYLLEMIDGLAPHLSVAVEALNYYKVWTQDVNTKRSQDVRDAHFALERFQEELRCLTTS